MDYKRLFIDELKTFLQRKGFIYQEKVPFYTLREPGMVKVIGLDISSFRSRSTILPNLVIRNESIAKVVQTIDGDRFKGEYYFSIRTNQPDLAFFFNRPEYRIGLHVLKDDITLNASITNFKSFMEDLGFSFFERFKTISDFDNWFNTDVLNRSHNFKLGNSGDSAKEGLIAAKLNNNPRFEELYELWISGLKTEKKFDDYIEPLKSLKAYLDNYC